MRSYESNYKVFGDSPEIQTNHAPATHSRDYMERLGERDEEVQKGMLAARVWVHAHKQELVIE